jgi:methionine-gamma-lyase
MAKDNIKGLRPETLAVAFGYDPEMGMGSVKPPIFMTSTFVYPSAQHAKDVHPGLDFLEKRLAAIDGAEEAVAYSSGMAAHSSIALAYVRPGDSVLHGRPIYGGVDMLFNSIMPQFGSHVAAYTDGTDENDVRKAADEAMAKGPLKLIIAETPANPTAAVVDLDLMVRIADEVGAKQGHRPLVVVDNTLLGPFAQRPIEHGVDLCMTSLTKYCGGHSDLLAGGISGRKELIDHLRMQRTTWGNHLDPYTSWLVLRSLESVAVRTECAMQNARGVAEFLRDHPKVAGVTYLGFLEPGTRRRAVFDRQCKAAGSTFSFHLHGGEAEAFRMLDQLELLKVAVSLGGSETLICHSASTTHYAVPPAQRLAGGITDGTIRLSVGLEHVDDLIGDLRQALEAV